MFGGGKLTDFLTDRIKLIDKTVNCFFLLLAQSALLSLRTCVLSLTPTDGMARIFSTNSYAVTGKLTHVSSVAPLLRDLNSGRVTS